MAVRQRSHLVAAALAMTTAACNGGGAADDASGTDVDTPVATSGEQSSTPSSATAPVLGDPPAPADGSLFLPGDIDDGLQPWIGLATADLATRLAIDAAAIEPVSAVLVVWPDVSLGCPEPDRQYATIVTDGAVIELAVDGVVYRYHAGGSQTPFLCSNPITTAPSRL